MKKITAIKREVVTREECTYLRCDLCGIVSDIPGGEGWEYGGVGWATGALSTSWNIDGESGTESVDLCHVCAERLIRLTKNGKLAEMLKEAQT